MITSHCMLQSRLKVVLQCKYGESSRPSTIIYSFGDDKKNLRLKFEVDTETQFIYLFSLLLAWIEITVIVSRCL